jgi:phosphoesterase RecJ-like protein
LTEPVPAELIDALRTTSRPVLAAHVTPDADALSSVVGLAAGLATGTDAEPTVALPEGTVPEKLNFLFDWVETPVADDGDIEAADAVIVLDTAKLSRANVTGGGESLRRNGRPIINVDHHYTNPRYGDVNWVVDDASSTAELVYRILLALDVALTPDLASLLYTGIYTDTDGFSLPNTTADALTAAADLVRCGARVAEVGERSQRSRRQADFDLLRIIYDNTRLSPDGRIAYSTASHAEITGAGCRAADIDDQVYVPRSLDGIDFAILFTEGVEGKIRINFRGEKNNEVLELAQHFGGGGHRFAAGAIITGTVEDVAAQVVEEAARRLNGK